MSRLTKHIPFYEDFTKKIKLSLHNFGVNNSVTSNSYFANLLGFKGDNANTQFSNYVNGNGKNFTTRELIRLIELMGNDSKPILDYMCDKAGFVCSERATPHKHIEDIRDILQKFSIDNGLLNASFLNAIKDNNIDEEETKQLKELSYQFRARLLQFEFALSEKLK
ncbi:hypothetical protein AHALO_1687 [Malaciobacter halophilus]|nr:hypothetical protein [Malaciobacter halophilus]AXH10053.1 hypothetical protein AHALO_1687 [Malaciobacter halophilus]